MALLSSWGNYNKVTDEALQQSTYLLNVPDPSPGWMRLIYKLISTKRYSYVGMDLSTAQACANAKKQQYQLSSYTYNEGALRPELSPTTVDGAQVVAQRKDGCMYNVDIQVDAEQIIRFDYPHTYMPTRDEILSNFPPIDFDEDNTQQGA